MMLDSTGAWSADYVIADETTSGSTSLGHYISIDTDSSNLPSIAWYDDDAGLPYLTDFSSLGVTYTVPVDECLDPTGLFCPVHGSGLYTSVSVDAADGVWVAYQDQISADLGYACLDGTTWTSQIVDAPGNVGSYASLAFNSDSEPYIAYYDASNRVRG